MSFNHFPEIAAMWPAVMADIEAESAQLLLDRAVAKAPVATGELAASGHLEPGADGTDVVFDAVNEEGTPYAGFVELGTVDTPAQPFLLPASLETEPDFLGQLETLESRLPR